MNTIYLDNAATTYPKPMEVVRAVQECVVGYAVNPYRGSNTLVNKANSAVTACRERLASEFSVKSDQVSFVPSATYGLNFILQGFRLSPGANVYSSGYEHNAVARCLYHLENAGKIRQRKIPINAEMVLDELRLAHQFQVHPPELVVMTHASNVTGDVLPVATVASLTHRFGGAFLLDAAQTMGAYTPSAKEVDFDFATFSSHKGLYGIAGAGGLVVRSFNDKLVPLVSGGTGTESEALSMPNAMPHRFEAGTISVPAVVSMDAGLRWILANGKDVVRETIGSMVEHLVCSLRNTPRVKLYGHSDHVQNVGIVSFRIDGQAIHETAAHLNEHAVCIRAGLHCAPIAHQTIQTFPHGTIRTSLGFLNSHDHIEQLLRAVRKSSAM